LDLATNKDIINLIHNYRKSDLCAKSGKDISGGEKHFCSTTKKFYHSSEYEIKWIWESHESIEKEKLDGKSKDSWAIIDTFTRELEDCM
jgi:hypothetical protein